MKIIWNNILVDLREMTMENKNTIKKDFLIKRGNFKEILIERGDEKEFEDACEIFFKTIIDEMEKFNKERSENVKKWNEKSIDVKNIYFTPEKILKNSPLTIIDAPWGTGKTYFVENLITYFDKKIKEKQELFFEKIIFLDAWKYSISKNSPKELMNALLNAIGALNPKWKKEREKWEKENNKKIELGYNELNNFGEFPKTIIFLDNIERLGKQAWEILKAVWQLAELKNFLFILPMNQKQLDSNLKEYSGEAFFEKYIDIKYFVFKQNYLNFLTNMRFDTKNINILNDLLNTEIKGEKISIREAENRIRANDILDLSKKNTYDMLSVFVSKIWGTEEKVHSFLKKDVIYFIETLNELKDIFNNIKKEVENITVILVVLFEEIEISSEFTEITKYLFEYSFSPFINWDIYWNNWKQLIKSYLTTINILISEKASNIEKLHLKIIENNNHRKTQEKAIMQLSKKITKEEGFDTPNRENIQIWKLSNLSYETDIEKYNKNIENINTEIKETEDYKIELENILKSTQEHCLFIKSNISLYIKIKSNFLNKIEYQELWDKSNTYFQSKDDNELKLTSYTDDSFSSTLIDIILIKK